MLLAKTNFMPSRMRLLCLRQQRGDGQEWQNEESHGCEDWKIKCGAAAEPTPCGQSEAKRIAAAGCIHSCKEAEVCNLIDILLGVFKHAVGFCLQNLLPEEQGLPRTRIYCLENISKCMNFAVLLWINLVWVRFCINVLSMAVYALCIAVYGAQCVCKWLV